MTHESEIAEEQEYLDRSLTALGQMQDEARSLRDSALVAHMRGAGDLVERDVVMSTALQRIDQLAIGDQPLFFGRIDYADDSVRRGASYHVGRLAVSDRDLNPLVIDWRAPVAEPFYRATGVEPLELARRRHVAIRGRHVTGIEDEYFVDERPSDARSNGRTGHGGDELDTDLALGGPGALLAALGRARTGRMGDIVATIQAEQDKIIRSPIAGILLVQGGPGTGKTAVALHRAAYLLYTYRGTLERQGVLVVGPNPLFLGYIENVLPSLGESGVTLSTLAGLVTNVTVRGKEADELSQLKGDERMITFIARAVGTRQRPLREDVRIPLGRATIVLRAVDTVESIARARRRSGNHNQRRSALGRELAARLAQRYLGRYASAESDTTSTVADLAEQIRATTEFKDALRRMWPRLTGQELLHDLFGAPALVRAAGQGLLTDTEMGSLHRDRSHSLSEIAWTDADAALIDEARVLLGPRKRPRSILSPRGDAVRVANGIDLDAYDGPTRAAAQREAAREASAASDELDEAEFVTYGHIVVDEAQDLSPMQLRVLRRRDLSGSLTVVGDMGQATSTTDASWERTLRLLEPRRPPVFAALSVSYRTPEEVLAFARATLRAAEPDLEPPTPVRRVGQVPVVEEVEQGGLAKALARRCQTELDLAGDGRVAVIAVASRVRELVECLRASGISAADPSEPGSPGLAAPLVVVSAEEAHGLEFDSVIVLEPSQIVARGGQRGEVTTRGLRTLYVALTRPIRRLVVMHSDPLPETLR